MPAKAPGKIKSTAKKLAAKAASARRKPDAKPKARSTAEIAGLRERLAAAIPDPHVELHFKGPWELLVAVILSAQSTDKVVNVVMTELLSRWPTPAALGAAPQEEVEKVIYRTGFFRNKAKSIRATSQAIAERLGGQVPRTMEGLLELPGVARKSANVVLGSAYGIASGIVVDTHVMRVAQRLGLTRQTQPVKIEVDLCAAFPKEEWIHTSHRLVLHGRHVCTARAPKCERCPLNELCPSRETPPQNTWQQRAAGEASEMASRGESFSKVS